MNSSCQPISPSKRSQSDPINISVNEAENGYVIYRNGGHYGHSAKPYVCNNVAEVSEAIKAILGGTNAAGFSPSLRNGDHDR